MENKTIQKEQSQNRSCETCKKAPTCHNVVGYIFGTCSTSYEPIENVISRR